MNNFNFYSKYYDLLYETKNYTLESEYLSNLFIKYSDKVKNILELGSGTGNHAQFLTKKGYIITGIEKSESMSEIAKSKKIENFSSIHGDISDLYLNQKFDAVFSLFHVISYLNENFELLNTLKLVNKHLEIDGIFIFDVWYTPAVLSIKPDIKVKRIENSQIEVIRIAEPTINYNNNVIDINFNIIITNKSNNETHFINELHKMRHFSINEIDLLCKLSGFEILNNEEFLTSQKPSNNTWGVCFILKKVKNHE